MYNLQVEKNHSLHQ
ncbi:MAG: hypothetical protein DRI86_00900 [Bacteroidetes bacterium]|nr:MAG: hypothetical protein DRI86_00900 [Bacteroidota bacterium]